MKAPRLDGKVSRGNPLDVFFDIGADSSIHLETTAFYSIDLACSMLNDAAAAKRTPDAFAILCGSVVGLIEEVRALAREAGVANVSSEHASDMLWASFFDAYNYACDRIGDDAERRMPLAFAHLVVGFYSAWISNMRMQLPMKGGVLQ